MNIKYIGITIGPIYDTIRLSSSPAALWASSFIFSSISIKICEKVESLKGAELISPHHSNSSMREVKEKGIGLYHDRIIFQTKNVLKDLDEIKKSFTNIKEEISNLFITKNNVSEKNKIKAWFDKYLQIHAIAYDGKNGIITGSSTYLDAAELTKRYPIHTISNPIKELYKGSDKNPKIYCNIKKII